jgi:predicted dehydrogenase
MIGSPPVVSVSGKSYSEIEKQNEYLVEAFTDQARPGAFTPRKYDAREFSVEDFAVALVRLENNITISMKVSWALNAPEEANTTFISGTKGGLRILPTPEVYTTAAGYLVNIVPQIKAQDIPFGGHHRAAAHFLRAIRGEEALIVTEQQVLNVLRILDLLYESDGVNFETAR